MNTKTLMFKTKIFLSLGEGKIYMLYITLANFAPKQQPGIETTDHIVCIIKTMEVKLLASCFTNKRKMAKWQFKEIKDRKGNKNVSPVETKKFPL